MTETRIRKLIGWAVKLATIALTTPATFAMLANANAGKLEQFAGWLLIEGTFLSFWLLMDKRNQSGATVTYYAIGTVAMYGILLWVGAAVEGFVTALPPRLAAGIAISETVVPKALNWLANQRRYDAREDRLVGYKRRHERKRWRTAIRDVSRQMQSEFAKVYAQELGRRLQSQAEDIIERQPVASDGNGKSQVVISTHGEGLLEAWCPICQELVGTYDNARSAASGGNGHWKKHTNELRLAELPDTIMLNTERND